MHTCLLYNIISRTWWRWWWHCQPETKCRKSYSFYLDDRQMLTKGDSVQFTTTLVTHQEPFCFCSVVTAAAYFIPPQRRRRKTQTLAILQQFSFFLVIIPVPTVTCMHAHTHTHHHTTCIYIILLTYSLSPSRREKSLPIRTIFPSMGTNKNDIFLCIHRHTQKLYNAVSSVAYRKRKETEKVAFPQHNSSSS